MSFFLIRFIRIPVSGDQWTVTTLPGGQAVTSQALSLPPEILNIPARRNSSSATHDLVFQAENLPPLGSLFFKVRTNCDDR